MVAEWESDGVVLPAQIERALEADSLVLFCGAGISAASPSCLPGFRGLVEEIASEFGRSDLLPVSPDEPVQFDVVMGELNELQHDVHARVSTRLRTTVKPNSYHLDLLQISQASARTPRIVTTNFDLLFEAAANQLRVAVPTHMAPALPLGNDFDGLVHLHGPVDPSLGQRMVITDTDFGQAYITEGWATQFLTRMFERYTTLFVGYSADDTVMRYLARALPANGNTRFAFMEAEQASTMSVKWNRLGVTPIPYPSPEDARHVALRDFLEHWRNSLTATPSQRFDLIQSIVVRGPDDLPVAERELLRLINDPEHARHFRSVAEPAIWIPRLDALEGLDSLFDSAAVASEESDAWARWAAGAFRTDGGSVLLAAVARHDGRLSWGLWFQAWLRLYEGYEPIGQHRQWLLLLAADQPSRDSQRLSSLLRTVAEKDGPAAEILLHHLLIPRLRFRPHRGWSGSLNSLTSDLVLAWRDSSIRDAWPTLLPLLSDPDHLLSVVLSLIRGVEATDSIFSGNDRRYALSLRRQKVDGVEKYGPDDPYVLVVDIARDLLREFVRSEGPERAIRYLDNSSEMIQRLALDALSEARSSSANALLTLLIERDLVFGVSTKPEAFRLMKSMYRHATPDVKQELLAYIREADPRRNDAEIRDYERFNALVWLSADQPAEDQVHAALAAVQDEHSDFGPREHPDLDSWITVGSHSESESKPEGRFRGLTVEQVVAALAADTTLHDVYDSGPILRELRDFLEQTPDQELPLLDELVTQSLWSPSAWSTALKIAIRLGVAWTAEPLMQRLDQVPGHLDDIARGMVFSITHPTSGPEPLENANERCRLLLGLWRNVSVEQSIDAPTDPSEAQSTARGSLAYAYVETVLRATQDRGDSKVDDEGLSGFRDLLVAQADDLADPSPMMLARYGGHILAMAGEWFDSHLQPALLQIDESPQSRSLWAGILTGNYISKALRLRTRDAVRVGWPQVSRMLPGSIEAFVENHAAQFAYDTTAGEHTWADPFIAAAPVTTRIRWIRSVARRLDGEEPSFQDLLFAHWQHRIEGQPPILGPEQRALLDWVTLPGIDRNRAADLFTLGPAATTTEEDHGFDYYDLDDFAVQDNKAFLRVALHLLSGRTTLPTFLNLLVTAAMEAGDDDVELARQVWSELLALGYGPAREFLNDE